LAIGGSARSQCRESCSIRGTARDTRGLARAGCRENLEGSRELLEGNDPSPGCRGSPRLSRGVWIDGAELFSADNARYRGRRGRSRGCPRFLRPSRGRQFDNGRREAPGCAVWPSWNTGSRVRERTRASAPVVVGAVLGLLLNDLQHSFLHGHVGSVPEPHASRAAACRATPSSAARSLRITRTGTASRKPRKRPLSKKALRKVPSWRRGRSFGAIPPPK
jgi:hypothetical protein